MENGEDPFEVWEKEAAKASRYFKPEVGIPYDLKISRFEFGKKSFKEGEPEKWVLTAKLEKINGQPTEQEWNTSSGVIITALKPYRHSPEELASIKWRLRKIKQNDKTTYVFEDIGRC